jgi:hypothetical protein
MLDINSLNEFSRKVAQGIFREHPDWDAFASEAADEPGILGVVVPQSGTDPALWITTSGNEITIGFDDKFHTHLGAFQGITDDRAIEFALDTIREIIEERKIFWVILRDGKWKGAGLELSPAHRDADCLDRLPPEPGDTIHIYSWLGAYDCILEGEVKS